MLNVAVSSYGHVGKVPQFYVAFAQNEDVMTSNKRFKYNNPTMSQNAYIAKATHQMVPAKTVVGGTHAQNNAQKLPTFTMLPCMHICNICCWSFFSLTQILRYLRCLLVSCIYVRAIGIIYCPIAHTSPG